MVTRVWLFTSDAEGLADAGNSVSVTFAHDVADAAVKFICVTKGITATEYARRATTGQSWESWGIAAGGTVTAVQITGWTEKCVANTKLSSHSLTARIVGSGGASVHSAGNLLDVSLGITTDASYQAGAAGTQRAVDSGSQASTTDVRLELEYTLTTSGGGGTASTDQRFDTIELTITWTAPWGSEEALIPGSAYINETATAQRLVPGGAYVNETVAAAPPAPPAGGAHGAMYPRMQRHIHQSWTVPRIG